MNIAIDFDGTCVTHDFPEIGLDVGAEEVLHDIVRAGHNLILFTMRSDIDNPESSEPMIHAAGGRYLTDAIRWFSERQIPLWGIQTNPEQYTWTKSPKAYAHLYIDDAALGAPLIYGQHERPFIDWTSVRKYLVQNKII